MTIERQESNPNEPILVLQVFHFTRLFLELPRSLHENHDSQYRSRQRNSGSLERMVVVPVLRNIQATTDPDLVKALNIVQKAS